VSIDKALEHHPPNPNRVERMKTRSHRGPAQFLTDQVDPT